MSIRGSVPGVSHRMVDAGGLRIEFIRGLD
jgi:hypothetical protein